MRVTDEMVRSWLAWPRNFGEVVAYDIGRGSGRRFRVRLVAGVTRTGAPYRPKQGLLDLFGHDETDVVPAEMMLTAREALVFAYGCAVGRATALSGHRPDWYEEWPAEAIEEFVRRRAHAAEDERVVRERDSAEREAARERRAARARRASS